MGIETSEARHEAAKKAWVTRRERTRSEPAHKAWKTIRPSEQHWINKLAKEYGKSKSEIVHHPAFPDIMFEHEGHLLFFEVKPEKGSQKQTRLNDKQRETIRRILQSNINVLFYLATYDGRGKNAKPTNLTEITLDNIDRL